jgi:O-antigen ligase
MIRGSWQVWEAGAPSAAFGGVRIIPPGHVLMYVLSLVAFSLMMAPGQSHRSRALLAVQFVFLNISLLFTYTRAQWIASAVALALMIMALSWDAKRRMAGFLIKAIPVLALAYYFFGAAFQETLANSAFVTLLEHRVRSIFTPAETLESFSLEWRIFETGEALRSVGEHPILGVGLGNVYREPALLHGEAADGYYRLIRYVHNSYLYLAVKLGLLGLFACLWFVLAFLIGGLRAYLRMPGGPYKQATLAILAGLIGILLWSITQSLLMQGETTLVIGLMGGLIASMRQMYWP